MIAHARTGPQGKRSRTRGAGVAVARAVPAKRAASDSRAVVVASPTGPDRGARHAAAGGSAGARREHPVTTVSVGTTDGIVGSPSRAVSPSGSRVRVEPEEVLDGVALERRPVIAVRRLRARSRNISELGTRGHRRKEVEVHPSPQAAARVHPGGCSALGSLSDPAARTRSPFLAARSSPGWRSRPRSPRRAGDNECRGIMACIRVPAPGFLVTGRRIASSILLSAAPAAQRRRRPGRAGDLPRRSRRLRGTARRPPVGPGMTTNALRRLFFGRSRRRSGDRRSSRSRRTAPGRGRPLDGLRAHHANRSVDRVPLTHRRDRPGPGEVRYGSRASPTRSWSARGMRSRSASSSRRSSAAARWST